MAREVTLEEIQKITGNVRQQSPAVQTPSAGRSATIDDIRAITSKAREQMKTEAVTQPPRQVQQKPPATTKQSEAMKQNVDTLKKQRDDALIKAGAYHRAGMKQEEAEQLGIASRIYTDSVNAETKYKTQKNIEATEDYDPSKNKFKAGTATLASLQDFGQSFMQGAGVLSHYMGGGEAAYRQAGTSAKNLMDKGVSPKEALEASGVVKKDAAPITDYKTVAELKREKDRASVGTLEGLGLDTTGALAGMAVPAAASAIDPTHTAGLWLMAVSSLGHKYADAYEKYGNGDLAFALGLGAGAATYTTEQIGGVFGRLGGTKLGQAATKKLMSEVPGIYALATSTGGELLRVPLEEGLEEGAEDVVNYAIEKALTGESDEMDNIWYDMLLGALAGGVMGGANAATRAVNYNRLGKTLKKSPVAVQQQIEEGLSKGEGTAPAIYAAEAQKKPTPQMLGRLFEANQSFDAESGLSKIQGDITQLSVRELKAMMNNANAIVQAAETLGVKPTPESVMTEVFSKQKEAAIRTAQDGVGQAFSQMVDNPANAGEVAYNSAIQGAPANQSAAQKVYNDPAARESFAKLAGIEYTGNPAADVAAIEVATKKLGETGKQIVSEAEYTERMTEAAERATAELEAKAEAEADVLEQESLERWLSIEQNTDIDIDGKRHVREITNTDVRGDNEISYKKAEIPNSKKPAVNAVEGAAKFLGKTIVWYEGAINVNGNYRLANGYRAGDGTIYLNINSADPLMVTFGHEMLHDLVTHNEYEGMVKTLTDNSEFADKIGEIIQSKENLYRRNGIELDPNAALEEVAADISGEVLNDRKVMEYIGAKNAEVATGINKWLGKVLNKLRAKPSAQEAYNRLSESQKALLDGMEGRTESTNSAEDAGGSYSLMDASAMDSEYSAKEDALLDSSKVKIVGNGDVDIALPEGYEDIGIAVTGEGSAAPNRYSLMSLSESELGTDKVKYATRLAKATGVSVQMATDWIKSVYSVAAIIGDDKARLDYEANRNNTSLKPNSEYDFSLDFSTLCAKRLLFSGTMDAIQSALPNTPLTSEDFVHLREIMKDSGYEVACGICYVESTRREFSTISEGFVEQYRKAQAEGTNIKKVNASGQTKDLTTSKGIENSDPNRFVYPEKGFTPTLADLVTAEGIDRLQAEHPEVYKAFNAYMNARGQQKPKMIETRTDYRGEILNMTKWQVSRRNSHGGLRIQSFSDFEVPHLIDMMQAVYDMASMGLKGQAYTKVPSFARAMGRTGIKINLSLIAKGDGVDANGKLIFDDVEGMPAYEAFSIRNDPRFSENVGTILVGKNVKHIVTAMADPEIDFIIPFHKSSWSASLYKSLGLEGYEDFTDYQNEKKAGTKIENYDPAEYWDFSKTGDENAQIYLEKCRADGRTPKFAEVMYEGKSLTEYPGYWKLLIDYKMYNNDGVGAPQKAVKPVFDDAYNAKMLSEYKGGHGKLPVAHDIVDRFLKEKSEGSYSLMEDAQYRSEIADIEERTTARRVDAAIAEEQTKVAKKIASAMDEGGKEYVSAVDTVESLRGQLSDLRKQIKAERKHNAAEVKANKKWAEAEKRLMLDIEKAKAKEAAARQKIESNERLRKLADEYRANRERDRIRRTLAADKEKLYKLLTKANSLAKKSSPENKSALMEMIGDIDLMGIGMLENGRVTSDGKVIQGRTELSELRNIYESYKAENPDFLGDLKLEKKLERLDKRQIADMSQGEIRDLIEAASALIHKVQTENTLINDEKRRTTFKTAQDVISELEQVKGRKDSKIDALKDLYGFESLRPKTAFLKMAGGQEGAWTSMYDMLNNGQYEMLRFQQQVANMFDPLSKKYFKEMAKWSGSKAEWMKVRSQNGMVEITPAMAISLYLHSLNNQNMRHIDTGIKIPNKELYTSGKMKNAYDRGRRVRFTKSDIEAIYNSFTPEMKEYANLAKKFFNETAKEGINKTSLALNGYEKATVDNYFPIKTDPNFTVRDIDTLVKDITIEGWKNLEERTNARNPAVLEDVDSVINRHIDATSKYVGLAIPIHNFNSVYNSMSAMYATSVKEQLRLKWEDQGARYVEKLLTNLQAGNNYAQDAISKGIRNIRGWSAQAVLSFNVPVSMKQVASLPTAASKLGWSAILHGLRKADENIINKYTPLMWYRSLGNIDTAYSEATKAKGGLNKLPRGVRQAIGLTWIQSFDRWAVNRIWTASEYWVEHNRPSLEIGSDAYYQEVARVFNVAVEETQPNYTTMQRPQILRNENELVRSVTMYQTQRLQNYNIFYENTIALQHAQAQLKKNNTPQNKAKVTAAKREMARSVSSLVSAAFMIGIIDAFAAGIMKRRFDELKDDEGNITPASVSALVGKKTADSLVGNVLFASELEEVLMAATGKDRWYGIDANGLAQINDTLDAITGFSKAFIDYTGNVSDALAEGTPISEINQTVYNGTLMKRIEKLGRSLSTMFGVPANNIVTFLGNGLSYVSPQFAGYWDNRNADGESDWKIRKGAELSWQEFYDYKAEVTKQKEARGGKSSNLRDKVNAIMAQPWPQERKEKAWEAIRGSGKKSLAAQVAAYSIPEGKSDMASVYAYLKESNIRNKEEIWEELFPNSKTTYSEYAKKH